MRKLGKVVFTIGWRPFIGPRARALTTRKFESTPARLARGEYLVMNVTDCMDCHAQHVADAFAYGARQLIIAPIAGAGFRVRSDIRRIHLSGKTLEDVHVLAGAQRSRQNGRVVCRPVDGHALFPFMPYPDLRSMSDEDLASVIVYVRSLPPVHKPQPPTTLIFPVKYLIRSVPQPLDAPVPEPDLSAPEKRGKYLVTIAGCTDCHTPQDAQGQPLPGMDFAGGFILEGPWGRVASANITPDPSGISDYDDTRFTQAIRTGYVKARKLSQIMPWHTYRGMNEEDTAAIFAYMKAISTFPKFPHPKVPIGRIDSFRIPSYKRVVKVIQAIWSWAARQAKT